jgi:glyoxylase I family protein
MPEWAKVSHTSFSVRDAEASAAWLERVLGLEELNRVEGDGWHGILLIHPASATLLEYQQHKAHRGERFDPRRTGLDHVGFQVPSRAALNDWLDHFEALGVEHSPIADREYGAVLTFRDPDGIQFEMFFREGHP